MKKLIFLSLIIFISFFTLSSQTISSLGITGTYYDIRADNTGTIHIIWIDNGWAKYGQIVNRQVVNQVTIPVIDRNEVNYRKFRPRLSVKPDGSEVHFVWATPLYQSKDLMHCWRNSGGTWNKEKIYTAVTYMLAPAFAVDSSGVYHAAIIEDNGQNVLHPIAYYRKAPGSSWTRMANLAPGTKEYLWPNLFTDTNGNVHITWDQDKDQIQYRYISSGGDLSTVSTTTLPLQFPHNKESEVFADASGNVHVAALSFPDGGTPGNINYWIKPAGGGFSSPVTVSGDSFRLENYFPYSAIIARSPDMVAVSWAETAYVANPATIRVSIYDGAWTVHTLSTTANVKADTRTTIAMDNETAYLVWREGDQMLYLATFDYAVFGVLSPNGGEEWGFAKTYDVRWNLENATGNVDINLFKNNVDLGPIVSDIANSGTYSWTIDTLESGAGIVSGTDYQIEVAAINGSASDKSNSEFSILPSIDITAPLVGVNWSMGTTQEIAWTKTGTQDDYVNITLFKSGSAVLNIGTTVDNSGSFFWDIPGSQTSGADYTIRVETTDGVVSDDSEIFSILESIDITSPAGGAEWVHGNTYTITWDVHGTMNDTVKLRIYQGAVKILGLSDSTENDGSFSWTVPADFPSASDYIVRVATIDNLVYDDSELFYIGEFLGTPTITVTSPVSSSNWSSGTTHTITWDRSGTQDSNVKIQLFKGGSFDSDISTITANDGIFSWTISNTQPSGSDYMARVTTLDDQVTDDSDNFTITLVVVTPTITVTSPASGSDWFTGSTQTITWDTTGTQDPNVKIELFKGGSLDSTISASTPNDGSLGWTIPADQTTGTDYVVRVTTLDDQLTDDSGIFSISDEPVDGIRVTSPAGGAEWMHNNTYNITWDHVGPMNNSVKIRIYQGATKILGVTDSTPNDGSFSLTIPDNIPPASDYIVRVATIDNLVLDDSDFFSISEEVVTPTITVTAPSSGTNWQSGSTQTITWDKTGVQDADVKIELFKGGSLDSTISATTSNDGSFSWTINGSQSTGSDYMVRIATIDGAVTDDSSNFTITYTAPEITVTSPAGGADWSRGSTYSINWSIAGSMDSNVKINLYKGGGLDSAITASTPNDGSFSWTIPADQTADTDYVVRITTIDDAVTDDSGVFTISDVPVDGIRVTSPVSGAEWIHGNTYDITWDHVGPMNDSVKIRIYQGATKILGVTDSTPNDGSFSLTIPDNIPPASDYIVRVATIDNLVLDDSDFFTISAEVVTPTLTVTAPISSSYWISGSTYAITWDTTGSQDSNVKINLYKGGSLDSAIIASTPNSGSYSWTIDGAQTPGADYVVRVTTIDDQVTDDSDQFEISDTAPATSIDITAPDKTSELSAGSNTTITWDATGSMASNVNIFLYDNGSFHSNIALNTANDGSYSWSVGSGILSSSRYSVRVETTDSAVSDDSDMFWIFGTGITVDMPESGDTLVKNSSVNITWKKVGSQHASVKLRLYQGSVKIVGISDLTPNDGSYTWTVPDTVPDADDYIIRVATIDNAYYDDTGLVSVAGAGILVTSPSTNNVLKKGSSYDITWASNGSQNSNVKIRVFQGAIQIASITDSTPNDGSYTWTVPGTIANANDLTILVKTIDNLVFDYSGKITIED